MQKTRTLLTWIGFILSMVCALINGIDMSFNVYALPLKETFNFTQKQVEILSSLDAIGLGLAILEIPFFNTFGYKITSFVSWLMVPVSSGFISMAAINNQYFSKSPGLLYIAQFTMALGNAFSLMTINRELFIHCPERHSGKLVALYSAMQCLGKVVFAVLIDFCFIDNLSGFFLTVSLTSSGTFAMCFIVLYFLTPDTQCSVFSEVTNPGSYGALEDSTASHCSSQSDAIDSSFGLSSEKTQTKAYCHADHISGGSVTGLFMEPGKPGVYLETEEINRSDRCCDSTNTVEAPSLESNAKKDTSWKELLTFSFFHLTMWPAVIFYSTPFVLMNNITIISDSMGFERPMNTVYLIALCIITTRLTFGVIVDKFPSVITGLILQLVGDVCLVVTLIIGMYFLFNTTSVYVMTIFTGVGLGSGFTVCAAILLIKYGKEHVNFIASLFYAVLTVCTTVNQLILGYLYDREIDSSADIFCYGNHCFYSTFSIFFTLVICVMAMQTTNLVRTACFKQHQLKNYLHT